MSNIIITELNIIITNGNSEVNVAWIMQRPSQNAMGHHIFNLQWDVKVCLFLAPYLKLQWHLLHTFTSHLHNTTSEKDEEIIETDKAVSVTLSPASFDALASKAPRKS